MNDSVSIFNMRTGTVEKINAIDFVPKLVQIQEELERENFDYEMNFKGDVEELCKRYYESKGYLCVKTWANTNKFPEIVVSYLEELYPLDSFPDLPHSCVGVPDFIVYKARDGKIVELFFVECKSRNDSLRLDQLRWVFSYTKIPSYIFWRVWF